MNKAAYSGLIITILMQSNATNGNMVDDLSRKNEICSN